MEDIIRDAKTLGELDLEQRELIGYASDAMQNAYEPYSRFTVGAAIRCLDDTIITGVNVENAAYPSTLCAERGAIMHAYAHGKRTFSSIAIIGQGAHYEATDPVGPCGGCRQMIYEASEVSGTDIEILMSNSRYDTIYVSSISELLPLPFGPSDLGIDVTQYRAR